MRGVFDLQRAEVPSVRLHHSSGRAGPQTARYGGGVLSPAKAVAVAFKK